MCILSWLREGSAREEAVTCDSVRVLSLISHHVSLPESSRKGDPLSLVSTHSQQRLVRGESWTVLGSLYQFQLCHQLAL